MYFNIACQVNKKKTYQQFQRENKIVEFRNSGPRNPIAARDCCFGRAAEGTEFCALHNITSNLDNFVYQNRHP